MTSKLTYGLAIFLSAFLLFQVEPMLGKMVLPWFGGSAGVWVVCLLFFQLTLLGGYLYAHLLTRKVKPHLQARIHAGLLLVSLLALPILPRVSWLPDTPNLPALHILAVLALTAGLPYFLLSANSPLLQAWYAQKPSAGTPYRFYAVSNIGSMLALVSYPVALEPWVGTRHQALGWSCAYAAVVFLCAAVALRASPPAMAEAPAEPVPRPSWQVQALWVGLAACGSALLLAITHHITQNIAAMPLLWIIPLALYLLTFILCFGDQRWYKRDFFLRLLGVAVGSLAYALSPSFAGLPLAVAVPFYCACLFVCCMFCHGELVRLKPHPAHLTEFYLMIALGGAVGAFLVALAAPWIFNGDYELRLVVACCAILVPVVHHRDAESPFYHARWQVAWLLLVGLVGAIVVSLAISARQEANTARLMVRNFYGVLRVVTEGGPPGAAGAPDFADADLRDQKLMHGSIDHGMEYLSPLRRMLPTTYYGPESGVGIALKSAQSTPSLNVGVIGLGVGTLAAYGRPGDHYQFYEINPLVERLARSDFNYLRLTPAKVGVVLGDARLSLEHEPLQGFDLLAVDAFSGDAIPVHLLTREAFALYFRHLKPHGTLAVHISNQFLDLAPVVEGAAHVMGKEAVKVSNNANAFKGISRATWIMVGNPDGFLGKDECEKAGEVLGPGSPQVLWTDDYSSLLRVLK